MQLSTFSRKFLYSNEHSLLNMYWALIILVISRLSKKERKKIYTEHNVLLQRPFTKMVMVLNEFPQFFISLLVAEDKICLKCFIRMPTNKIRFDYEYNSFDNLSWNHLQRYFSSHIIHIYDIPEKKFVVSTSTNCFFVPLRFYLRNFDRHWPNI